MKLVVGLGNPGEKYKSSRHNVGFELLDMLFQKLKAPEWTKSKKFEALFTKKGKLVLAKPTTFMNKSGKAVKKLANNYKTDTKDIWIAHDDLDIPLGEYKVQKGTGPREHRGVNSIEEFLKSEEFWRIRIGIDNRDSEDRERGEKYVLQKFSKEELVIINNKLDEISDRAIELIEK